MLIPIHISFIDLLDGHYRFVYQDLIENNRDFATRIEEQKFVLNNLTLVLGVSKGALLRQLKKGMKHPDAPNDQRGMIKRRQDGMIDVIGLSYETLNLIEFYQKEKRSSQVKGLGDRSLMDRIFRQEADRSPQDPTATSDDDDEEDDDTDTITSLAEYQGEMTENHYGAQSIGHAMPSERNMSLGTAMVKILKRGAILYRLALSDSKNATLPFGGPNPFWLGVIMHCLTDSYSTVHTIRYHYDPAQKTYHDLNWDRNSIPVDPKFEPYVPEKGTVHFSEWELKSAFSLFSRCLSNYFDDHFETIYSRLNQFDDPERLINFIIKTICRNYCSLDRSSPRVFCRTCQGSVLCRTLRRLDLFDPDHPDVEPFTEAYQTSTDPFSEPTYFRLDYFERFVAGYTDLTPKQREIRAKVIETINRLLFFKFREWEADQLFPKRNLSAVLRAMIRDDLEPGTDQQSLELEQIGGGSLWDAFTSTVSDLFQTARTALEPQPTLSQFRYYAKKRILRDKKRRQQHQSFIIDFHDYERQKDPPDLHLKCDFVQHPCLLEEIYDNLIHLTELYSHHLNYLYKLRLKSGENIQNTFYQKHRGDVTKIGDADPDYRSHSIEEWEARLSRCLTEFNEFFYQWVFKLNSLEAYQSRIKRFDVDSESCLAQSSHLASI
jgi:hypothetical protein